MESRRLVTALLVGLGVCLLIIGVFIGRELSREPATMAQPVAPAPAARPLPPIFEPPAPPATSPPPSPAAVDSVDRQRVAQYFRDVDRLQNVDVDNPQAAAQSLIAAASSGDTSGLQKLVTQAQRAETHARALTPPPACASYHKKVLALLADNRSVLQQLARGIGNGSVDGLPALLTRANATKARAESLVREENELKRRYGL